MAQAGIVQTVSGPIAQEDLGYTLMHEHLLCDLTPLSRRNKGLDEVVITLENVFDVTYRPNDYHGNHQLQDLGVATREAQRFRAAGGGAIVEMTTGGLCPDPHGLAHIAAETGAHVILGAGFYTEAYQDAETLELSVEALADIITAQVLEGAWGTSIRCGIIGEIGCSWPLTAFERRSLQAGASAQQRTGAAVTVHPGRHPDAPHEILDIMEAAGADLSRVIIDHMDRTYTSVEQVVGLVRRGCIVEYDFFGIEQSQYWMGVADLPTDYMRIHAVRKLFEEGFGNSVVLSHDICTRSRLQCYGGHGYAHMIRNVMPLMRDRGFSEGEIDLLFKETPARLLALV